MTDLGQRGGSSVAPSAADAKVSLLLVRGLVRVVEQAGVSQCRFLHAARLEPALLEEPEARLPLPELYRLCELAMDLTGEPALGLHWGESFGPHTFAPLSHLVAHSANLRDGLAVAAQFGRVLSDVQGYELLECADKAIIRAQPLEAGFQRGERFAYEMVITGMFRVIRAFNHDVQPHRVSFAYAAPPYRAQYDRFFGCEVQFEQPFTELEFDRALLDAPAPHRDPGIQEAMHALAERRVQGLVNGVSHGSRVRDFLLQQETPSQVGMRTVATSLGLSERSLRRHLAAEGTSYDTVRDDVLATVAKRLLQDRGLTIQETAYEMGFSGTSTFHRAFKRWTGTTPGAYLRGARCG